MRKSRKFVLLIAAAAVISLPVALAQAITPAPTATTGPASDVKDSSAVLNGTVNPQGQKGTYHFDYGTTTSYTLQTSPHTIAATTGTVAVHADVTGLVPGVTYHFRIVAQTAAGTSAGADETFTTGSSHVAFLGRIGFVSPGGVIGVEAGCFGGEADCVGHVTMSHDGVVIGQRDFDIAHESGGFQNIALSSYGRRLLRQNRMFHLLAIGVHVTTTSGQSASQVMRLARWVWH